MTELMSPESWEVARGMASKIGVPPSSFSTVIRFLRTDAEQNNGVLGDVSKFSLLRLLKSQSVLSPLYFAAKTFREPALSKKDKLSPQDLVSLFKPEELSIIIMLLYTIRVVKKFIPEDEWKVWLPQSEALLEIGGHLGQYIPKIGFSLGLLAGISRPLGHASILLMDKARFIKYRRSLKTRKVLFDLQEELETWGSTNAQIASVILQTLGMGIRIPTALARGLLPTESSEDELPEDVLSAKTAIAWIESLYLTGNIPNMVHRAQYYPKNDDLTALLQLTKQIREKGSKYSWLTKGKDDIGPEKTPELFPKQAEPAAQKTEEPSPEEEVFVEPDALTTEADR